MDDRTWNDPSVQRIRRVVVALGADLTDQVVFIGGSIAPLLHTSALFDAPRPTKDLVPAGDHLGSSGQEWDRIAVEHRVAADLRDGIAAWHADAPTFLCLKWAAYNDRGNNDPHTSNDLQDIIALIAARDSLVEEAEASGIVACSFIATQAAKIVGRADFDDLLAGHLHNSQDPYQVHQLVSAQLTRLSTTRSHS